MILLATSWLITPRLGGVGSPSLMTTMCLVIASWIAFKPFMAIWSDGSKSGMSPGVMRSIARSMLFRPVPIGRRVKSHASWPSQCKQPGVVVARKRLDRGLGDDLLPVVPLGNLAGVHDQRHRADALDLDRLDLHVDRQGLFDRRVHPAAGAEAVAAAEHDQARPHVVAVGRQELVLALGERLLGDVAQDHRVVRLKLGQIGRQRVAADAARAVDPGGGQHLDLDLLLAQGLDQLGVLAARPLDQEHLGLAAGVGEPLGDVVDRPAVAAALVGNEFGRERVKIGFGDELLEREDVDAALQLDRHGLLVADGRAPGSCRPSGRSAAFPRVGSLARITTLMLTVSPFLTSGGIDTFSTSTSRS